MTIQLPVLLTTRLTTAFYTILTFSYLFYIQMHLFKIITTVLNKLTTRTLNKTAAQQSTNAHCYCNNESLLTRFLPTSSLILSHCSFTVVFLVCFELSYETTKPRNTHQLGCKKIVKMVENINNNFGASTVQQFSFVWWTPARSMWRPRPRPEASLTVGFNFAIQIDYFTCNDETVFQQLRFAQFNR